MRLRRYPRWDYATLDIGRLHFAAGRHTVRARGIHRIACNVVQAVLMKDGPFLCVGWASRIKA